jgi:NitT/TauT family transport system permease protein
MSTPFPSAPMAPPVASPVDAASPTPSPRSAPAQAAAQAANKQAAKSNAQPSAKAVPKCIPLMARPRVQRVVYPMLVGLVLIALWQGLVTAMELPPYLVPSPILMMKTLFTDWAALGGSLWVTVKITVLAFVVATVAGVLISFLFVQSKRIETALFPYAVLLQVTPIVAVAPLIIIWVKDPTASMVICAALVALFPIISNTTLRLRIPSALPYFFGGLRISSGLALIGAVVAEFVAGTGGQGAGLAYQILQAGFQLNIPRMFAALLLISLTGVALFALMAWLTRMALGGWHASENSMD